MTTWRFGLKVSHTTAYKSVLWHAETRVSGLDKPVPSTPHHVTIYLQSYDILITQDSLIYVSIEVRNAQILLDIPGGLGNSQKTKNSFSLFYEGDVVHYGAQRHGPSEPNCLQQTTKQQEKRGEHSSRHLRRIGDLEGKGQDDRLSVCVCVCSVVLLSKLTISMQIKA